MTQSSNPSALAALIAFIFLTESSSGPVFPEKPVYDCVGKPDGSYENPVDPCGSIYYQCVGEVAYETHCRTNSSYDRVLDQCDLRDNVFACSGKTRAPTPPNVSTSLMPIDCLFLADGDYEDPEKNCSSVYYTCASGYAFKRSCPRGLYFNSTSDRCDHFSNVPDCTGKTRETTTAGPVPKTPRPNYPFDCTKRLDANYSADACVQNYWSCVGGLTFPHFCMLGLVYDDEFDICEFEQMVPKCGGQRITKAPMRSFIPKEEKSLFNCTRLADGNYTDLQAADKCSAFFYTCLNGLSHKMACSNGLLYDHSRDTCDHRENVADCNGTPVAPKSTVAPIDNISTLPAETTSLPVTEVVPGSVPPGRPKRSQHPIEAFESQLANITVNASIPVICDLDCPTTAPDSSVVNITVNASIPVICDLDCPTPTSQTRP